MTDDELPSTSELQAAIVAAARSSGRPVLDAGRGQPNWLATTPRSGFFTLGRFAVDEAAAASRSALWGEAPPADGLADRLAGFLAADGSEGAAFLATAVRYGIDELGFQPDPWVHELVRAVLGAGYASPTRMLTHLEQVLERYLVTVTDSEPGPAGRFHVFATEGGAAAMAYVFRTLQENELVGPGDKIAIATPIFTPYLQIPVLEDFGFDVVELKAAHNAPYRFDDGFLEQLLDPAIKVFFVVNPGNPDSRAIRPERLRQLRDLVLERRPDLIIVADTVYATFVEGFRSILADLPRHVICLHSFSKSFGATGNRLGFVAVHADNAVDELLAAQAGPTRDRQQARYRSVTSDVAALPFIARMVADSREVALHNIAGLATPDQVQMALFALASLMPAGAPYTAALRAELARRLDALLTPLGVPAPGGQDSMYYALVDLLAVCRARHGDDVAAWLAANVRPEQVALHLAREHSVVVLPGQIYDADSWDVRVSLASLDSDELHAVGVAIGSTARRRHPERRGLTADIRVPCEERGQKPPAIFVRTAGSAVVGVLAGRVVGEVLDLLDAVDGLDEHPLHAVQHREAAHRAAVAAAAHREVGRALAVVADVGDEAAVLGERRVDLGGHHRLDLRRELVVTGEPLDDRRRRPVGVLDHEALGVGVVERGPLQELDVAGRDDDLEVAVGADLVGERRREVLVEAEVVAEGLAGPGRDLQAQPELGGLGLGVAQLEQLGQRVRRDLDDRLADRGRLGGRAGEWTRTFDGTHAFTLPATAVDLEALTGDVAGPVAAEPQDGRGDVLGLADPPER